MADRTNDSQLLQIYLATRSPDAFSKIVRLHLPLVYSVALRSVGRDTHLAEDVTQAVFMVLVRKARHIPDDGALLTGWLIRTTRYAASNAMRIERRRKHHEQRAAAMTAMTEKPQEADASALAPLLHQGLATLSARDQTAVVLRYFYNLANRDIGADLGISEEAAQKRIVRALEKIRRFMFRHGVTTHELALEGVLRCEASCAVPAGLMATVLAASSQPALHVAGFSIAKLTLKAMSLVHAKVAVAAAVVVLAVAGGAKVLVSEQPVATAAPPASTPVDTAAPSNPAPQAVAAPPATAPTVLALANDSFSLKEGNQLDSKIGLDPAVMRSGVPSMLSSSTSREWGKSTVAGQVLKPVPFVGKRVRFSAFVKTADVANWAGLIVVVFGEGNRILVSDDMCDRSISQAADWTRLEIVADIPPDSKAMICGSVLYGAGKLWLDGAQIEQVADTVPTTDDQNWRTWSFSRPKYSQTLDFNNLREGQPTICVSSTTPGSGEWCEWGNNNRRGDKYVGKRLKITAWIMTEDATGPSGFSLRFLGNGGKDLVPNAGKRTIRGTTEWTKYELVADVPPGTVHICAGVRLGGSGKLWVDDLQFEFLEPDAAVGKQK